MTGYVLAVIGVVLVLLAVIHHFVTTSFLNFPYAAWIFGVVGVVILIAGVIVRQIDVKAK